MFFRLSSALVLLWSLCTWSLFFITLCPKWVVLLKLSSIDAWREECYFICLASCAFVYTSPFVVCFLPLVCKLNLTLNLPLLFWSTVTNYSMFVHLIIPVCAAGYSCVCVCIYFFFWHSCLNMSFKKASQVRIIIKAKIVFAFKELVGFWVAGEDHSKQECSNQPGLTLSSIAKAK